MKYTILTFSNTSYPDSTGYTNWCYQIVIRDVLSISHTLHKNIAILSMNLFHHDSNLRSPMLNSLREWGERRSTRVSSRSVL